MKYFTLTLLAVASLGLSACMSTTYDSGASYATGRTAGETDTVVKAVKTYKPVAKRVERTYTQQLSK